MIDLLQLERQCWEGGFDLVCGVDEAGRGPLAGPVCAAAVILPRDAAIEGLNDSKKLSDAKRRSLYDCITSEAYAYGVAFASVEEIEEVNILNATFRAMGRAVAAMGVPPDIVLVDGNRQPPLGMPTRTVIGGDGLSASIAAASILAKVTRDRLMEALDREYPQYGFAVHKGYGTRRHYEALRTLLLRELGGRDDIRFHLPEGGVPYIVHLSVPGLRSETLLHFLAERGVSVSSGSACSKGRKSPVLTAMGLPSPEIDSALRLSFCYENTEQDIRQFLDALEEAMASLARKGR